MTRPLSPGEQAALFALLFFATAGIWTWALTLPDVALYGLGIGWGLVIAKVITWAERG